MKRLFPFVVLIILLLAGILAVPFLLRPESHRTEITEKISALLKRPAVIGPITMGYWPPSLRLAQVSVLREGGEPLLQIDSVVAPLDWMALFRLQLVPNEIQLHRWSLTTLRHVDGSWDLKDWLWGTAGSSGTSPWPITFVSWKDGEIHAVDPYAGVPQELVLISVEGKWDPKKGALSTQGTFTGVAAPAKVAFTAKGQFFASPQWSGDLQLTEGSNTCAFHLEKKPDALDAQGNSSNWSLSNALALIKFYGRGAVSTGFSEKPLLIANWQLHAVVASGRLTFEHTAMIDGGLSELKGSVVQAPAGPLARLDVALKDVPAEAVWNAAGTPIALTGKITSLAKDVELVLSSQTLSTIKGQGYWELKEGRYRVPEVSLNKLARAKTMGYVKKKFPDLVEQGFPVMKLSAHWQAKNGAVTVSDGLLVSTDVKVAWVGKLDAARQGLDGFVRIEIREKNPALSRLIPEKYRSQSAYGRLQGTWQEWFLRAIPSSKIPSAAQAKLLKAIHQK